jgi:hypothetical protein
MNRTALLVLAGVLFTPTFAHAAPTITNLSLRGLQIGQTTNLTIDGEGLSPETRVMLDAPIVRQEVRPGATAQRVEVALTLDAAVQPGIYPLRVVTPQGVSNTVGIGIDHLPQQPFVSVVDTLPVALTGTVSGSQILEIKFAGQAGQRVVVDVETVRLGAKLRPVVRLEDPQGVQLAWSQPLRVIGGDARLETTLPANGQYTVRLHDLLYRAPAPGIFRLKIGDLHYADLTFPLGVERAKESELEAVSSSLPNDAKIPVGPGQFGAGSPIAAPLPAVAGLTGARPALFVSDFPELVETPEEAGAMQTLPLPPAAVSGRLATPKEEDRYAVLVTPGSKIRVSVTARQVGSPLDGVLSLRNESGGQLAANDDRPGQSDPGVEFNVPADVNKLVIALKDLLGRSGESFIYRIVVENLSQPRFALSLDTDRLNLAAGATQVLKVQATRQGYNGPIDLHVKNLTAGVTAEGATIAEGETIGLLTLTAAPDAAAQGVVSVVGQANVGGTNFTAVAQAPANELSEVHAWMRNDLGFAVGAPAPLAMAWDLSDPGHLVLGGRTPLQVTVDRRDSQVGPVRLRLLTTQVTPKKKEKKDNQDVEVDDIDRTLRLAADAVIPAGANQGVFEIMTPADLAVQPWGVVLVADALAADGKTVLASIATPTRRLTPQSPIALALTGPAEIEAKAGAGETGRFVGKLTRFGGYAQPVTVTLEGLPTGYPAPQARVAGDQTEFVLSVSFPYGAAPGRLEGLKLVATTSPIPTDAKALLRSEAATVALTVVPGEKPPAEPPLAIFEDDAKFVEHLNQGGGQVSLVEDDKHSGKAAVRVTPDQRYNENIPGLGVKIRQNPGPGEYRYLRFAWKKQGGASICLQLNHDGAWGPQDASRPNAKFRYHSGPGGECYSASLVVADPLPEDWVVVTRDLFEDFGEFTFNGLALSPVDGEYALFDHIYLGRSPADFELAKP